MKFTLNTPKSKVKFDPRTDPISDLVRSTPVIFEPGEAEAIIAKAQERLTQIEANGFKVCRHENEAIRGFVLSTLDFLPYIIGHYIDNIEHHGYYVNQDYYYTEYDSKVIDHGFTETDLGSTFFVAELSDPDQMPGYNKCIPGSICADMRWSQERNDKLNAFCQQFAPEIDCRAVNYLSHSLIYAHDLNRGLLSKTLGVFGYIDYIQQEYDAENDLCPFGRMNDGWPRWSARGIWTYMDGAAVLLVR